MYRFIPPLIVLVPQDSNLRARLLTVLRAVYAIVRLSSGKPPLVMSKAKCPLGNICFN